MTMRAIDASVCRLCGYNGGVMFRVLELGHHPLADRFLTADDLELPETRYPLALEVCTACGYAGLSHPVPAMARYENGEYSYTAGNSPVSVAHFDELADAARRESGLTPFDLAIDIGGNDGTLLQAIGNLVNARLLNIEPSSAGEVARKRGIGTHAVYWSRALVEWLLPQHGAAKLILATNVLNHATDLRDFVRAVAQMLAPDGMFVFEVPSLHELVTRRAFDTIYLEHVSYWGLRQLERLLGHAGLGIVRVDETPYMGGSLRVFAKRGGAAHRLEIPPDPTTLDWQAFAHDVAHLRDELRGRVHRIRAGGGKIVAIGAAAKGNTLLNYCGFDGSTIECVTDASPHKIGKFTPGSHLPIVSDDAIPPGVTHALILPWNIAGYLIHQLQKKRPEIEPIVPFAHADALDKMVALTKAWMDIMEPPSPSPSNPSTGTGGGVGGNDGNDPGLL